MDTLAHIKNELLKARPHKKLTATFHSLVLAHADELQHIGPDCFCESVGMTNVWRIEFRKYHKDAWPFVFHEAVCRNLFGGVDDRGHVRPEHTDDVSEHTSKTRIVRL